MYRQILLIICSISLLLTCCETAHKRQNKVEESYSDFKHQIDFQDGYMNTHVKLISENSLIIFEDTISTDNSLGLAKSIKVNQPLHDFTIVISDTIVKNLNSFNAKKFVSFRVVSGKLYISSSDQMYVYD